MSEPSKEAVARARKHYDDIVNCDDGQERGDAVRSLASTIQKLMDERDSAEGDYQRGYDKGQENACLGHEQEMHKIADALGLPRSNDWFPAIPQASDIVASIQKLMDERDAAEKRSASAMREHRRALAQQLEWAKSTYDVEMRARAEAAEKACNETEMRAIRAEVRAVELESSEFAANAERAAAEARLAECVREVWKAYSNCNNRPTIGEVLNKYTSATPPSPAGPDKTEHPDTIRLRAMISDLEEVSELDQPYHWVRDIIDKYESDK